jgi:hypothetical protein
MRDIGRTRLDRTLLNGDRLVQATVPTHGRVSVEQRVAEV